MSEQDNTQTQPAAAADTLNSPIEQLTPTADTAPVAADPATLPPPVVEDITAPAAAPEAPAQVDASAPAAPEAAPADAAPAADTSATQPAADAQPAAAASDSAIPAATSTADTAAPAVQESATPAEATPEAAPAAVADAPDAAPAPTQSADPVPAQPDPAPVESLVAPVADATATTATQADAPPAQEDISVPAAVPVEVTPAATPTADAAPEAPAEKTLADEVLEYIQTLFPNVKELSPETLRVIEGMGRFIASMGPNNITPAATGAGFQRALYGYMTGVLLQADWEVAAEALLYFFQKHRHSHFNERLSLRFMDEMRMQRADMYRFQALMQVFTSGADPKGRALVSKQVDFNQLSTLLQDNTLRERVAQVFKF